MSGPDPDAFAALLADYCLEVQPGQQVLVRSTTLAAPLLLALQRALLEREAWPLLRPELPGADEGFWRPARDVHLDGFPSADLAEMEGDRRAGRHPGAGQHARARGRRRGADGPRRPRPAARCATPACRSAGA